MVRFAISLATIYMSFLLGTAAAAKGEMTNAQIEKERQRAGELAHEDKLDSALAILKPLLVMRPDNYEIRRDYVVISAWNGDCDEAVAKYQPMADRTPKEDYIISPIAHCLKERRQTDEALALLRYGSKTYPNNGDIKQAHKDLLNDISIEARPTLDITFGTDESDAGSRENSLSVRYTRQLTKNTRWFVRYFTKRGNDEEFETEDMNRIGGGLMHWFHPQWYGEVELSTDTNESDYDGQRYMLSFYPTSLLSLRAEFTTYTEDLSLRAVEVETDAERFTLAADYHTSDYRWELSAAVSDYSFSDGNNRNSLYAAAGYGYILNADFEERLIVSLYQSENDDQNVVYYSPEEDTDITVTNRTSFEVDTKYLRHWDHVELYIGRYDQKGFDTKFTYGAKYIQDYDFDQISSLSWNVGAASRVYDGDRESNFSIFVHYHRKLL